MKPRANLSRAKYADSLIAKGEQVSNACKTAGISTAAYYRWRKTAIEYVFFYGSLRQGEEGYIELSLDKFLDHFGKDAIPGALYDLGSYPGIRYRGPDGQYKIQGELYRIVDKAVMPILDRFERYEHKRKSLYQRKLFTTLNHEIRAWTYVYVGSVKQKHLIKTGDWLEYKSGV